MSDSQTLRVGIVYKGEKHTVCYIDTSGKTDFKIILDQLESDDKSEHKKVVALIKRVGDKGVPVNDEKSRSIQAFKGLFELKTTRARMPCFYWKRSIVITHMFFKKGRKNRQSEYQYAAQLQQKL